MPNISFSQKVFAVSPHLEMIARRLYWRNVKRLSKKVKQNDKEKEVIPADFNKVLDFLKKNGVVTQSLLVIHSSFDALKGTQKKPDAILDDLFSLIGNQGTLAMPAMPKFKNDPLPEEYLSRDISDLVFEYDVQKTKIKTGVLPGFLFKRPGAIRSRHPINTMVALGPLAETLMNDNLKGDSPLACGVNSSWKKCVDNDAIVVGLGTDLTHSLTMIHVAEDVKDDIWPIKNWYREKKFVIRDQDFNKSIALRERLPKWGALHFGERTLCNDLLKNGIMQSATIDGIVVEVLKAKDLISFLNSKNNKGYPYFWVNHVI